MGFARKDVEATKRCEKKFVRYQEGAEKYSLGLTKFQALAKEAKVNILRWRSHPISWNRAMESVIESHSSDGGSHDPCRGSQ